MKLNLAKIKFIILALVLSLSSILNLSLSFPNSKELWDLGSFLMSGWNTLQGNSPYEWSNQDSFGALYGGTLTGPNVNSPTSLFFFVPLSLLPFTTAVYLWYGLSLLSILFLIGCVVCEQEELNLDRKVVLALLLFASSGVWQGIELIQLYAFFGLFSYLSVRAFRKEQLLLASVPLGVIVSMKPQFIFMLAFLYLSGEKRLALKSGLLAIALWILAAFVFGPSTYLDWIHAADEKTIELAEFFLLQMSFFTLIASLLSAELARIACILLLCCYTYFVAQNHRASSIETKIALGFAGPLLFLPFAWIGYLVLLFPLIAKHHKRAITFTALLGFAIPLYCVYTIGVGTKLEEDGLILFEFFYPACLGCLVYGLARSGKFDGKANLSTQKNITPSDGQAVVKT